MLTALDLELERLLSCDVCGRYGFFQLLLQFPDSVISRPTSLTSITADQQQPAGLLIL